MDSTTSEQGNDPGMNGLGIRASLAALAIGCIFPIVSISAFLIYHIYEHQQAQLIVDTLNRVKAINSAVDREIGATQATLQSLGNASSLAKGDLRSFHEQAIETAKNLHVTSIVLFDTNGQIVDSTLNSYGESLPKMNKMPLLQHVIQTGTPGVSDLFMGLISGRLVYTIGVPIKRDNQTVYSLNAMIRNDQLFNVFNEQRLPKSWNVIITDSSGSIVAKTHDLELSFGKKVMPALLQRLSTTNEEAFETTTPEGAPVFVIYSRSPVTNWVVSVSMPQDEVKGDRRTLALMIFASTIALLAGLILAWLIGGRIAKSITALISPAKALGSRKAVRIPALHFKEANALGQALLDAETTLQRTQYEAHHDALTGMANRAMFDIVVDQQILLCQRNGSSLAIMYIDLDGFKAVNDTYGHSVGDLLLKEVAQRITRAIRHSDFAARFGGDEFAIALIDSDVVAAKIFAENLLNILSESYRLGQIDANVSASIGVAGYPDSGADLATLLESADSAMYKAKISGKQCVCVAA